MKIDIHSYARQAQLAFKRVDECDLSARNKELLNEFLNYLIANAYSHPRICRYADVLRFWGFGTLDVLSGYFFSYIK